ncbi:MAG TPA: hypothetical protein VGK31_05575 [Thermoanaerobaculia bacterium]
MNVLSMFLAVILAIEHNKGFSVLKDDAAATAKIVLVAGALDRSSAPLEALTDGALPKEEDEPSANVFFRAGTWGGRVRIDLGDAIDIAQVNTYSWHPDIRAPQLYKLYGSDEAASNFDPLPPSKFDPATRGWKMIAFVDTRTGDDGGQYIVRISDSTGSLGRYRYLLMDCFETEGDDDWGNTFYSEIDVVAKK